MLRANKQGGGQRLLRSRKGGRDQEWKTIAIEILGEEWNIPKAVKSMAVQFYENNQLYTLPNYVRQSPAKLETLRNVDDGPPLDIGPISKPCSRPRNRNLSPSCSQLISHMGSPWEEGWAGHTARDQQLSLGHKPASHFLPRSPKGSPSAVPAICWVST